MFLCCVGVGFKFVRMLCVCGFEEDYFIVMEFLEDLFVCFE